VAEDQAIAAAREAALRLLERARRTRRELERKLADSGHDRAAVARALDRLTEVGLVDDLEAAKAFVRAQWARRPTSAAIVRRRLVVRGVSPAVVAEALAALADEESPRADDTHALASEDEQLALRRPDAEGERARAHRTAESLVRRYAKLEPRIARARLAGALSRRGFGRDAIASAMAGAFAVPIEGGDGERPDPATPGSPKRFLGRT
jgi:regulatory protein